VKVQWIASPEIVGHPGWIGQTTTLPDHVARDFRLLGFVRILTPEPELLPDEPVIETTAVEPTIEKAISVRGKSRQRRKE